VTGPHGAGKTQLLMQLRATFEEASSRVLHVRCRAHESVQRGALLRRLFAQLCGHDVWPSLQHITPMLASPANGAEEALVEYELRLLHAAAGPAGQPARGVDQELHLSSPAAPSAPPPPGQPTIDTGDHAGQSTSVYPLPDPPPVATDSSPDALAVAAAAAAVGQRQEGRGRLVIIIDDLHHADTHSCEVLKQFASSAPEQALVLLACREPRVSLGAPSSGATTTDGEETQFSSGHRLVHTLTAIRDGITPLNLRPVGPAGCEALACAAIAAVSLPTAVKTLLTRRSGGSPELCQAIARTLLQRGNLVLDEEKGACTLSPSASDRQLNGSATEALCEARHSVLSVKIAELSMLQQLVLKTMSLLPQPCSQGLLMLAVPLQIDLPTLLAQLRTLRERHLIAVPQSHRRSLPGVLAGTSREESTYHFVDVGMREVCQHLMVDSQKRQIRLKAAAVSESKNLLGSLADSITSSVSAADELRRSLSPNQLRRSRLRASDTAARPPEGNTGSGPSEEHLASGGNVSDGDPHWWLARPGAGNKMVSPGSRLVQRTQRGIRKEASSVPTSLLSRASPSRLHGGAGFKGGSPLPHMMATWSGRSRPSSQLASSLTARSPSSHSDSSTFGALKGTAGRTTSPTFGALRRSNRSNSPLSESSRSSAQRKRMPSKLGTMASSSTQVRRHHGHQRQPPLGQKHFAHRMRVRIGFLKSAFRGIHPRSRKNAPIAPSPTCLCKAPEDQERDISRTPVTHLVVGTNDFKTPVRDVSQGREPSSEQCSPQHGQGSASPPSPMRGSPLVLLPGHVQAQLCATDKSLDGRLASLKHTDEGLAILVGSHRTGKSSSARRLFM